MKNLLAHPQRKLLQRLANAKVLLAFDYDGTLAPLASDPAQATMREETRRLLSRVARVYPCAVVTGRDRAGAARLLKGIPLLQIVGNHGAEWSEPGSQRLRIERLVSRWCRHLGPLASQIPGVVLEDKRYSLALHFRGARDRKRAQAALEAAVSALPACRMVRGILTVNAVPVQAPHKGDALRKLLDVARSKVALYLGDDVTDEDAFALGAHANVVGVRVGRSRDSLAGYFLARQSLVDELLRRLYGMRFERGARFVSDEQVARRS